MRIALTISILLGATAALAAPAPPLTARFSGGCDVYTIAVTGETSHQPHLVLGYNITLKPSSGDPIIVTDSFPITSESDSFRQTFTTSWHKFDIALNSNYALSGTANLLSDLNVVSSVKMSFVRAKLNCRSK